MRNGYELLELLPKRSTPSPSTVEMNGNHENSRCSNSNDGGLTERLSSNILCTENKSYCPRIYFNHKCFTGPSLSKSKICQLPKYVGPGPVILVLQEVISKILFVAYVPNRVLNELSSTTLHDLLVKEGLSKSCQRILFKAKYQKRTYRDHVPITLEATHVEQYCRTICEHLKCCYNLFGPNLYDGDDCPAHCRHLTKSNKFMRRPLFYREQAKLGLVFNGKEGTKDKVAPKKKRMKKPYGGAKKKTKPSSSATSSSHPQPALPSTRSATVVNSQILAPGNNGVNNKQGQSTGHQIRIPVTRPGSRLSNEETRVKSSTPQMKHEEDSTEDEEFEEVQQLDDGSNQSSLKAENLQGMENGSKSKVTPEEVNQWSVEDVHDFLKTTESSIFANILREQVMIHDRGLIRLH